MYKKRRNKVLQKLVFEAKKKPNFEQSLVKVRF